MSKQQHILIGLTGGAGSGKTTAANILVQQYGFTRIAFADPLKDMLRTMFRGFGWTEEMVERYIAGDLKETPIPQIGMTTSRWLQQSLGTEWGRDRVYDRLWVVLLEAKVQGLYETGVTKIVVDDVRMPNEATCILNEAMRFYSAIYRVMPEGALRRKAGNHRSEIGLGSDFVEADLVHDYSMTTIQREIERKIVAPLGLTKEGPWHHG